MSSLIFISSGKGHWPEQCEEVRSRAKVASTLYSHHASQVPHVALLDSATWALMPKDVFTMYMQLIENLRAFGPEFWERGYILDRCLKL